MNEARWWGRLAMVALSVGVAVALIWYAIITRNSAERTPVDSIEFNQSVQTAVEYGGETSRAIMQITIGLLAILVGVLVAKSEASLLVGAWQERTIFLLAGLLLFGSLMMFIWYSDAVTSACASGIQTKEAKAVLGAKLDAGDKEPKYHIPDVFGGRFDIWWLLQKYFFYAGVLVAFLLFVTAHFIKGGLQT